MDYELEGCGGCRTCEIACSFKHTGEFNHQEASIWIIEKSIESGYFVRLIEDISTGRIPCDACVDIDGDPYCVRFCHKREGLLEIIDSFKKQFLDDERELPDNG